MSSTSSRRRVCAARVVATGLLVAVAAVGACTERSNEVRAAAEAPDRAVAPDGVVRDVWSLVPGEGRVTAVWLGPSVRGPAGPVFRFLNVVHHGPDDRFAAFSRPVVDPRSGPVRFEDLGLSVEVRPRGGDWLAVADREDLEVTVELP